jgi:type IV pilus assembly protein PilW
MHLTHSKEKHAGLSLVELLVSLVISLFLILGISWAYVGSKNVYRTEENLARMQESGRLAFEYLSRDLRQAGNFGCAALATAYQAGGSAAACNWPSSTVPTTICTLGGTGCANIGASQPIFGYEGKLSDGTTASSNSDSILITLATSPCEGTGSSNGAVTIDKDPPGGNAANIGVNISGTTLTNCVKPGDILIATDCKNSAIFQACQVNTSGIITHDTGNNGGCASPAYGNTCKDWGNNYKGGSILKLIRNAYYVKNNSDNIPTLYRKNMVSNIEYELVPYIEKFQVQYGVASTVDDYPNKYDTANNITDWNLVKSVRIELLVRSPDDSISTDVQKIYFDGATFTSTDKRLRLTMGSTIGIRNRTLLSSK